MFTDFEKKYIKESLFEELLDYQRYSFRPQLIGLIQLDNCLDDSAMHDHQLRQYSSGNTYYSVRRFKMYQKRFSQYLSLLDEDETIFPSKEQFFSSLFINRKYQFLNFARQDFRDTRYIDLDGEVATISLFTPVNYETDKPYNTKRVVHTRIQKGNIVRFYDRELTTLNQFNNESCYLTLSLEDISDERFNTVFKASNFRIETAPIDEPVEFLVDKLIKEMIKSGETYTEKNPTNKNVRELITSHYFDEEREVRIRDVNGKMLEEEFDISIYDSLRVGDVIELDNTYEIVELKSLETPTAEIIVKEVKNA